MLTFAGLAQNLNEASASVLNNQLRMLARNSLRAFTRRPLSQYHECDDHGK